MYRELDKILYVLTSYINWILLRRHLVQSIVESNLSRLTKKIICVTDVIEIQRNDYIKLISGVVEGQNYTYQARVEIGSTEL